MNSQTFVSMAVEEENTERINNQLHNDTIIAYAWEQVVDAIRDEIEIDDAEITHNYNRLPITGDLIYVALPTSDWRVVVPVSIIVVCSKSTGKVVAAHIQQFYYTNINGATTPTNNLQRAVAKQVEVYQMESAEMKGLSRG